MLEWFMVKSPSIDFAQAPGCANTAGAACLKATFAFSLYLFQPGLNSLFDNVADRHAWSNSFFLSHMNPKLIDEFRVHVHFHLHLHACIRLHVNDSTIDL